MGSVRLAHAAARQADDVALLDEIRAPHGGQGRASDHLHRARLRAEEHRRGPRRVQEGARRARVQQADAADDDKIIKEFQNGLKKDGRRRHVRDGRRRRDADRGQPRVPHGAVRPTRLSRRRRRAHPPPRPDEEILIKRFAFRNKSTPSSTCTRRSRRRASRRAPVRTTPSSSLCSGSTTSTSRCTCPWRALRSRLIEQRGEYINTAAQGELPAVEVLAAEGASQAVWFEVRRRSMPCGQTPKTPTAHNQGNVPLVERRAEAFE